MTHAREFPQKLRRLQAQQRRQWYEGAADDHPLDQRQSEANRMPSIRTRDIVAMTGLSQRYWQRRLAAGEILGVASIQLGKRRTFIVDKDAFAAWWQKQLTPVSPRTSESAPRSIGIGSPAKAFRMKDRFNPSSLESLRNDLKRR